MKKILALTVALLVSAPAFAIEQVGSSDYARCAALAGASAIQQRDIVKDLDAAKNVQNVAEGYRLAAMLSTDPAIGDSRTHIDGVIAELMPEYQAKLTTKDAAAAVIFKTDTEACAAMEPQAYALIKKFNDFQASRAK